MSIPRGNGAQACAACRHQRRKCEPNCLLAPYFPHHRQRQFLNAHKLFGVKNISNIIKPLHPLRRDDAMRTIIIQSDARAADPALGAYGLIRDLQLQIDHHHAELNAVLHHLAFYRSQSLHAPADDSSSSPALNCDPLSFYQSQSQSQSQSQQQKNQQYLWQYDQATSFQDPEWAMQDPALCCLQQKQQPVNSESEDGKPPQPEVGEAADENQELNFEPEELLQWRFEPLTLSLVSS